MSKRSLKDREFHARVATAELLKALHWHKFFNNMDHVIRGHAKVAGLHAAMAEIPYFFWAVSHPDMPEIHIIWDTFRDSWFETLAEMQADALATGAEAALKADTDDK